MTHAQRRPAARRTSEERSPAAGPWWMVRSDKAICSQGCGARCCKASFISLTPAEAALLPALARGLRVPEPEIVANEKTRDEAGNVQELIMYAQPCTFLGKDNLCRIYKDRPAHCREFPDQSREWCPLSWKRFGEPGWRP